MAVFEDVPAAIRRRTVTWRWSGVAAGVVAAVLIATSLVTAAGFLSIGCRPAWWTVAAWLLVALLPGWATVLAWSGLAVLAPQRRASADASA